jgi:uncharacterized Zn-binding protein involved in type VI secretion
MPGPLVDVASTLLCPHGGKVQITSSDTRVTASGQPVATIGDVYVVSGCPFTTPAGVPEPCVSVQWTVGAARVTIEGRPALVTSAVGLCQGNVPAPPSIVPAQLRAQGT